MKEQRDTPRPTMSDEEMVKDYPRLAREYTLLHQDYREAIRKPLNIPDVSQQRELLKFFIETQASELFKTETGFKWREDMIEETIKNFNRG